MSKKLLLFQSVVIALMVLVAVLLLSDGKLLQGLIYIVFAALFSLYTLTEYREMVNKKE